MPKKAHDPVKKAQREADGKILDPLIKWDKVAIVGSDGKTIDKDRTIDGLRVALRLHLQRIGQYVAPGAAGKTGGSIDSYAAIPENHRIDIQKFAYKYWNEAKEILEYTEEKVKRKREAVKFNDMRDAVQYDFLAKHAAKDRAEWSTFRLNVETVLKRTFRSSGHATGVVYWLADDMEKELAALGKAKKAS